jgi:hypothetical protein
MEPDDAVHEDGGHDGHDEQASRVADGLPDGYAERLAEARRSAIEAGRRKGGVAGAAMAGAMLAVAEIYEGPRKDEAPVTVEASGEPDDVDRDGIGVTVGEVDVAAPPLERLDPVVGDSRKRPRR